MQKKPEDIFRSCGGQLRMSEAIKCGISRYMLYALRDKGVIEQVSRGVYRLVDLPPISNPDLVTVGLRFPNAVICLVSALAYHEITTQIPHSVSVAVPRESRKPFLNYPPLSAHRFSDPGVVKKVVAFLVRYNLCFFIVLSGLLRIQNNSFRSIPVTAFA